MEAKKKYLFPFFQVFGGLASPLSSFFHLFWREHVSDDDAQPQRTHQLSNQQ